jgi:hypothetical protein
MPTQYLVKLSSIDTCQLLDALSLRAEKWERRITCEVDNDSEATHEALGIASHYRQIILSIEKQMEEQRQK